MPFTFPTVETTSAPPLPSPSEVLQSPQGKEPAIPLIDVSRVKRKGEQADDELFSERKVKVESQAHIIILPIWLFACVVLELEIRIELDVFANWQQDTSIKVGRAPLLVLALVKGLGGHVWNQMVGVNRKRSFDGQFVPVTPSEKAILPIEIGAVAVSNQNLGPDRKAKGNGLNGSIFVGLVRLDDQAVAGFKN